MCIDPLLSFCRRRWEPVDSLWMPRNLVVFSTHAFPIGFHGNAVTSNRNHVYTVQIDRYNRQPNKTKLPTPCTRKQEHQQTACDTRSIPTVWTTSIKWWHVTPGMNPYSARRPTRNECPGRTMLPDDNVTLCSIHEQCNVWKNVIQICGA